MDCYSYHAYLTLFPGPAQISAHLQYGKATESWAGPGNEANAYLPYTFEGENFRGLLAFATPKDAMPQILWRKLLHIYIYPQNREIHKSFLPRKFSAIQYVYTQPNAQSITFQILMTHFHSFYTYRQWRSSSIYSPRYIYSSQSRFTDPRLAFWTSHTITSNGTST